MAADKPRVTNHQYHICTINACMPMAAHLEHACPTAWAHTLNSPLPQGHRVELGLAVKIVKRVAKMKECQATVLADKDLRAVLLKVADAASKRDATWELFKVGAGGRCARCCRSSSVY